MRITSPPPKKESMRTDNIFRQFYTVALWDGTSPTYHFVTPDSISTAESGGVNLPWLNPVLQHYCKIRKNFKPCKTLQGFFLFVCLLQISEKLPDLQNLLERTLMFFLSESLIAFLFWFRRFGPLNKTPVKKTRFLLN